MTNVNLTSSGSVHPGPSQQRSYLPPPPPPPVSVPSFLPVTVGSNSSRFLLCRLSVFCVFLTSIIPFSLPSHPKVPLLRQSSGIFDSFTPWNSLSQWTLPSRFKSLEQRNLSNKFYRNILFHVYVWRKKKHVMFYLKKFFLFNFFSKCTF